MRCDTKYRVTQTHDICMYKVSCDPTLNLTTHKPTMTLLLQPPMLLICIHGSRPDPGLDARPRSIQNLVHAPMVLSHAISAVRMPPRTTPNIPVSPTQKPKRKSCFTKLLLLATLHVPGIGATYRTSRPGNFSECSILHLVSVLICSNYLNPLFASLIYVFQYTSTVLPSLVVPSIACPAASMPFLDLSRRGPSFPVSAPSHLGATLPSQSTHTCKS